MPQRLASGGLHEQLHEVGADRVAQSRRAAELGLSIAHRVERHAEVIRFGVVDQLVVHEPNAVIDAAVGERRVGFADGEVDEIDDAGCAAGARPRRRRVEHHQVDHVAGVGGDRGIRGRHQRCVSRLDLNWRPLRLECVLTDLGHDVHFAPPQRTEPPQLDRPRADAVDPGGHRDAGGQQRIAVDQRHSAERHALHVSHPRHAVAIRIEALEHRDDRQVREQLQRQRAGLPCEDAARSRIGEHVEVDRGVARSHRERIALIQLREHSLSRRVVQRPSRGTRGVRD